MLDFFVTLIFLYIHTHNCQSYIETVTAFWQFSDEYDDDDDNMARHQLHDLLIDLFIYCVYNVYAIACIIICWGAKCVYVCIYQELSKTGDRHVNVVALLECKVRQW